ncbi:MAG: CBS domain-containing protein [Rhodospirillales bacterium]|nr:CBS domain-containing protein [Rhodospirillales bacterium]
MRRQVIPDIVKNQAICELTEQSTVFEAARQMMDCNVAAVVILGEDGKLMGIVTERDLTRRVLAEELDPKKTTMAEIMTANPDTLSPDDTAAEALELMRTRQYRHLPVAEDGKVVGMVSIRDLYAAVQSELEENIKETEAFVFGDRYGA